MLEWLLRHFVPTNPSFLRQGFSNISIFFRNNPKRVRNAPDQTKQVTKNASVTRLSAQAQELTQHRWYTLAFLHNISTPLSIVASIIEEMLPDLDQETAHVLDRTMRSLLGTTHLHQTSLFGAWQAETFDLAAETRTLLPVLQTMADGYKVILRTNSRPALVHGYKAAWEQILINLTNNSRNSLIRTGKNPSSSWMRLTIQATDTGLQIWWTDTGPGIPQHIWEQAQTPLSPQWAPKHHGYGLRSVRFWWENAFGGDIRLRTWPYWALYFSVDSPERESE